MNLIPVSPPWLLVILASLMIAAAVEDAWRLRISNVTCLGVIIAALAAMAFAGFDFSLWKNAVNFIVLLGIGTVLFGAGKIGGGDVKLMAALGLWFDFSGAIWLLACVFIAGGLFALFFLLLRLVKGRKTGPNNRGAMIPYGLAIVAGALFVSAAQLGVGKPAPQKPDPFKIQRLG